MEELSIDPNSIGVGGRAINAQLFPDSRHRAYLVGIGPAMTLLNSAFDWHPISIYYIVEGKCESATSSPSLRSIGMGLEPNPGLDSTLGAVFVSVITSAV
jgi:hypothetical protein